VEIGAHHPTSAVTSGAKVMALHAVTTVLMAITGTIPATMAVTALNVEIGARHPTSVVTSGAKEMALHAVTTVLMAMAVTVQSAITGARPLILAITSGPRATVLHAAMTVSIALTAATIAAGHFKVATVLRCTHKSTAHVTSLARCAEIAVLLRVPMLFSTWKVVDVPSATNHRLGNRFISLHRHRLQ
jgi:hypothetical protein